MTLIYSRNARFHESYYLLLQLTRLHRSIPNYEFRFETYKGENEQNTFKSCTLHTSTYTFNPKCVSFHMTQYVNYNILNNKHQTITHV